MGSGCCTTLRWGDTPPKINNRETHHVDEASVHKHGREEAIPLVWLRGVLGVGDGRHRWRLVAGKGKGVGGGAIVVQSIARLETKKHTHTHNSTRDRPSW